MKEEIGVENFDRYKETLFLNNWKDAVGRAGSEGEDRDLIIEVQVRGVLKRDVDEGERKEVGLGKQYCNILRNKKYIL